LSPICQLTSEDIKHQLIIIFFKIDGLWDRLGKPPNDARVKWMKQLGTASSARVAFGPRHTKRSSIIKVEDITLKEGKKWTEGGEQQQEGKTC